MSHKLIKSTEKKKLQKVNSAEIVAKSVIEYVVAVWGIALCVFVPLYLKTDITVSGQQNTKCTKIYL